MKLSAILLTSMLATAPTARGQTWDAFADFACSNPNGAWSYGFRQISWGTSFYPMTSCGSFGCPITSWIEPAVAAMSIGRAPSGSSACHTWAAPAGVVLAHPGPGSEHAVLRWTAPAPAQVSVNVMFMGIDYAYPTSTSCELMHNGSPLWGVSVNSYGVAYPHAETVVVAAGDTIEAVIGNLGNYTGDATALTLTIVATPCPGASVASIGAGCGPTGPQLSSTLPQVGTTVTLAVTGAPPSVSGTLYAGAPAPALPIGGGCSVHLHIATIFELLTIATNPAGTWSVSVYLPPDPSLLGLSAGLQGVVFVAAPPGFVLTSALLVTVGC
jgi:hypothetical protein